MKWVLWVFFLSVWSLQGIPMTPGFSGTMIYDSEAECLESTKAMRRPHVCMSADMPAPFPIAIPIREYERRIMERLGEMGIERAF